MSLAIYPLDPSFPRGYVLPRHSRVTVRAADRMAHAKRFTDAELAAEYWRAACIDETFMAAEDVFSAEYDRALELTMTVRRFATLPQYDKETP